MDQLTLTLALGPIFVGGFAVQQFLEIATAILNLDSKASFAKYKKVILGVASLIVGVLLAHWIPEFRALHALKVNTKDWLDVTTSAFVLSAGTEGVNSILKFFKYSKEDMKETAASKDPSGGAAASVSAAVPTMEALKKMNLK